MLLHSGSVRRFGLALAAAVGCVASAAACPRSCLYIPLGPDYCTAAAQVDTSGFPNTYRCAGYQGGYSIPRGTLYSAAGSGFDGCQPRTTVEDDFSLNGAPAGTVVPLTARLSLSLLASDNMGPGNAYAGLVEGASNSTALNWNLIYFGDGSTRDTVLTVPVTAIVGTPFHMRYVVGAEVGELCYAQWHGTFDFTGFPAGVSVVSCNGYALAPTPTLPTSWGRLKARYR